MNKAFMFILANLMNTEQFQSVDFSLLRILSVLSLRNFELLVELESAVFQF